MKLNKKSRIIGLSVILAFLITVVIWMILPAPADEEANKVMEITPSPKVDMVKTPMTEKYYLGETLGARAYDRSFNISTGRFKNKTVYFDVLDVIDTGTGQALFSIPQNIFFEEKVLSWVCFDADNNLGCIYFNSAKEVISVQIYDLEGTPIGAETVLTGLEAYIFDNGEGYKYFSIDQLEMDNEHFYLRCSAMSLPSLLVYNRDGNQTFSVEDTRSFDFDNNGKLYVISEALPGGQGGYSKVDADTGEVDYFAKKQGNCLAISLQRDTGTVYLATSDGVDLYAATDGAFTANALSWILDAPVSIPEEQRLVSIAVNNENSIYCIFRRTVEKFTDLPCYIFRIADDKRVEIPYTLTIQAPYRVEEIANAIHKFEMAHPDQHIKYDFDYLSHSEFYANRTEYGDKLALGLLTGAPTDILVLGSSLINHLDMMKTDVFMDLTELIKNDPSYEKLDKNILEAMVVNDKIRALPLTHNFPLVEVNTALFEKLGIAPDFENMTWSDFLDIVDLLEQKDANAALLANYSGGSAINSNLNRMIISNISDLVDIDSKKMDIRQKWFIDLLERWKKASKSPKMSTDIESDFIDNFGGKALFAIDILGETIAYGHDADLFLNYKKYNDVPGQASTYIPIFKGEKHANRVGSSENLFAISNVSKNKEAAWQFLSFAMTDEVQGSKKLYGRPLNKAVRAERMQKAVKYVVGKRSTVDTSEYTKLLDSLSDSVDYMYVLEGYWVDLLKPILDYMNDKITLDEALKTAEHDIWIRLNE